MYWLIFIGIFSVLAFFLNYGKSLRVRGKSPPGPFPLPFIGNLLYIARQDPINFLALDKVSKKYGVLTTLQIGPTNNILISRSDVAKDILSRADCLNRPINGALQERSLNQNIGMAFSVGEAWHNTRKFTSKAMRDYGFGNRSAMEVLIKEELTFLVKFINEQIDEKQDGVLFFKNFFQVSLLNLMTSMMTGKRHDYQDKELKDLIQASRDWSEVPVTGVLTVMAFPWTRFICPGLLGYTKQVEALKKMHDYARRVLEKHRKQYNFIEEPTCFTESFLKAAHEKKHTPSNPFSDDHFAVLFVDLLQGGSDTSSSWLGLAIALLALHPEIQENLVNEIKEVIGYNSVPDLSHKEKMIYTQAVTLEVHRFAKVTCIMPPRETTEDFYYNNYLIKKGTTILVNLHSCYNDPEVWGDPEIFRPSRFLSPDGTQLVNTENMGIIFGAGRRVCFGQSLALDSSFLYLTTLLQNFSFAIPPTDKYPKLVAESEPGIIMSPKPFYAKVQRRRSN